MGAFILYWLSKFLVGLFFVGLVGSAVVVVITFVEDGQLLLEGDEAKSKQSEENKETVRAARGAFQQS